jgi:peptidoglycan/LPS O-acetylase OafA/YrhL
MKKQLPTHERTGSSPPPLQIIDVVRGFSILSVLCLHLMQSTAVQPPQNHWMERFWFLISRNGTYGVFLFFVVSGFLITRMLAAVSPSLFRPRFKEFYIRRAGRILPLLVLMVMAGALMVYFCTASTPEYFYCFKNPQASFDGLFWSSIVTFSFNWYRILHENISPSLGLHWDVLWSLSIEEQFYFFYPLLLVWLGNEKRFLWFLTAAIILAPLSSWAAYRYNPHSFLIFMNSFTAFGSIALGALLYFLIDRFGGALVKKNRTCGFFCLGGFLVLAVIYFGTSIQDPRDCVFGPWAVSVGLFFFLLGGIPLGLLESRRFLILSLPGKVSYGAYLLHAGVLYFISPFLSGRDASLYFTVFILVTTGISWLSHRFFEIPLNRWIRKTLGAPPFRKEGGFPRLKT